MQANKVSDLLPIPDDVKQPHAYQVFGLQGGEQDGERVKAAILKTINHLKERKPSADPKTWKQAAKLVQQAESILMDPAKRLELDAMFGVVHIPESDESSAGVSTTRSPNTDPLAAILPSSDPLADILPSTNPIAGPTPPAPSPSATPVAPAATPLTELGGNSITIKGVAPRRKRRSKTNWFLVLATLGLFSIVGILAYFVFFGPGELAITSSDGQFTIRKGSAAAGVKQTDKRADSIDPKDFDPVMPRSSTAPTYDASVDASKANLESMGTDPEPGTGLPPELNRLLDDVSDQRSEPSKQIETGMESPDMKVQPAEKRNDADATPGMREPGDDQESGEDPAEMLKVEPPMEGDSVEMTDEMVEATHRQIEELRSLLRNAKWKEMTPAASALKEAVLTDEQRQEVESLYELADLASYYYGAVERGILSRQPAETIQVTETLTIAIVEVGPDLLVIRYAGKNKSFKFDEIPLSLSHRLAEFTLPADKATNVAAKACFQSLAPKSNNEYRDESIEWLKSIDGDVPGANPKQLAETIKRLFR